MEIFLEWVIAIAALVALILTLYEIHSTRNHNKLSVKPLLNFHRETHRDDNIFSIEVENCGFGPAIVTDFIMKFNNVQITDNVMFNTDELNKILNFACRTEYVIELIPKNYTIKTDQKFTLFKITCDRSIRFPSDILSKKLEIRIYFQSIYNDKFVLKFPEAFLYN